MTKLKNFYLRLLINQTELQLMAFACVALATCASHAAIVQRIKPDGSKTFSDQPCPLGSKDTATPQPISQSLSQPLIQPTRSAATSLDEYKNTAEKLRLEQKAEENAYLARFDAAIGPKCIKLFRALPPMHTIYYEQNNSAEKAEFIKLGCPAKVIAEQTAYFKKSEATKLRHAILLAQIKPDSAASETAYSILEKKMAALQREQEALSQASMNHSGESPQCRQPGKKLEQARQDNKASAEMSAARSGYQRLDCEAKAKAIWTERRDKDNANYEARVAVRKEMRVVGQALPARTAQTPQCKKLADQMATIMLTGAQRESNVQAAKQASSQMDEQKCDSNLLEQSLARQMAAFSAKVDSQTANPCEAKRALQDDLRRLKAVTSVSNNQQEIAALEVRISTLSKRCP